MRKVISMLAMTLTMGVFAGTAHSSIYSETAVEYVRNSLLEQEAKEAIISGINDDIEAKNWVTKYDGVIYSLSTLDVPVSKNQKVFVRKTIERDTIKRASLVAQSNLALYLDNGRLDREKFTDKEAADYALRVSYSARIAGLQSSANVVEGVAVGLVWVGTGNITDIEEPVSEKQITDNYCSYLYGKAQSFFDRGDYVQALETLKQIRFMSWANVKAYIGASICFLKMNKSDDAEKLAKEVFSVLSKDMTSEEMSSVSKVLYHSGNKDEAFKVLLRAYEKLKSK